MAIQPGGITGQICDVPSGKNCQAITLSIESPYQPIPQIDYAKAGLFWGLAFTSVIFLYLFSKGIGLILNMVKNA